MSVAIRLQQLIAGKLKDFRNYEKYENNPKKYPKEKTTLPKCSRAMERAKFALNKYIIIDVPINKITSYTHQPEIYSKRKNYYLKQIKNQGNNVIFNKHPSGYNYKDEYAVAEGHHRIEAAKLYGAKTVRMSITKFNKRH
jgi:hypothetical protein